MVPNAHREDRSIEDALSELEQVMVQAGLEVYSDPGATSDTNAQASATDRQQKLALLAKTLLQARQLVAALRDSDHESSNGQNIDALLEVLASSLDGAVDQLENGKKQLQSLKQVIEKAGDMQ